MEFENMSGGAAVGTVEAPPVAAIGEKQLLDFLKILQEYKSGLSRTHGRIIASENWWKLRNTMEEKTETNIGGDGGFTSRSAWMHNVIVSKHADAMEAYPEPNIRPREQADTKEATMLSAIIPCILEQNDFENVYSDAMWQKCKTGTGCILYNTDTNRKCKENKYLNAAFL